jgi:hypothetical protein
VSPPGPKDCDGRSRPEPAIIEQSVADPTDTGHSSGSRQVSWWSVHQHVAALLAEVGSWPLAGTPTWCALDDDDPRKLAALLDAAQNWALRIETMQEAACEASRAVSAAADWSAIGQRIRDGAEFYAAHPWLKRGA